MEKINVAELLKDCPKGMELDCLLCNSPIALESVAGDESTYPIKAVSKDGFHHVFTAYGELYNHDDAKCVIFPKGKTTWEGFVPPSQFKDGDIVFTTLGNIAIIRKPIGGEVFYVYGIMVGNGFYKDETAKVVVERPATEEEKQKLFKAIKDNGYKWNAETKTLEKLVEPQFKVGDRIKHKDDKTVITITGIKDNYYLIQFYNLNKNDYQTEKVSFKDQDKYELASHKFDINTLVPFESRVLVRGNEEADWIPTFWGYESMTGYVTTFGEWRYCIPYEGNEHLMGNTDDCNDFYKTWK